MSGRLSIRAMQYFLSAVDQGSIARAALDMSVAPSAISNAIDQVEEQIGLKLVLRFPAKGLQTTASGVAMVRKIRHLIEEYDNLIAGGGELRDALSGRLSIGYYAPIAPAFLPSILKPMLKQSPDIRVQCVECNNESAQAGLLDGRFDVIVFVSDNAKQGIACETLIDAPPYLLTPRTHRLAKQNSVRFDELADINLVLLDLPFTSQYLRGLIDGHDIDPTIVATASSTEMVRGLVGAGVGCSILAMRPVIDRTYGGDQVVAVPIRTPLAPLRLALGYLGDKPRRIVQAFKVACLDYFAQPAAQKLISPK